MSDAAGTTPRTEVTTDPPPRALRPRRDVILGGSLCVVLTAVLTWSSWRPGWLLYRDFVGVPDPVVGPAALGAGGAPRAVPLDLVTALLDPVVPAATQQRLLLSLAVVGGGTGVVWLLRRHGLAAVLVGGAAATWNPFVAERLLLGQPPTLLAYAMLPWVVAAARARTSYPRRAVLLLLAAAPAALTPWGGVSAATTAVVAALWATDARPWSVRLRWAGACAALGVLWCLPWVVPAVSHGVAVDPAGAVAFAAADDTGWGPLVSLMTLGGVWAPGAVPSSRTSVLAVVAALLLLVLATWGVGTLAQRRLATAVALAACWAVPVLVAVLLATESGLRVARVALEVPGLALARDTHRLLGPAALAVAAAAGLAAGDLSRRLDRLTEPGLRATLLGPAGLALFGAGLAVLTVPDLPGRTAVAYRPVAYPPDWSPAIEAAQRLSEQDRASGGAGRVLVLPWQPFRQVGWAGTAPFLDPTPRALDAPVVSARDLTVVRDGRPVTVTEGDPAVATEWAAGRLDPDTLRRLGVVAVVIWQDTPGTEPAQVAPLTAVFSGPDFEVWAHHPNG